MRSARDLPGEGGTLVRARFSPQLLGFFVLLCLLVQGTAVQTHVHFASPTQPSSVTSSGEQAQLSRPGKGEAPGDCPLCQEAAMAGAYVLPPAIVLPVPPEPVSWVAASAIAGFDLLTSSHAWRSRAPPQ